MTFNQDSFLVKLWARKVNEGAITLVEVPRLYNLYEEVEKLVITQ